MYRFVICARICIIEMITDMFAHTYVCMYVGTICSGGVVVVCKDFCGSIFCSSDTNCHFDVVLGDIQSSEIEVDAPSLVVSYSGMVC